jgi:hypothetical protein
MCLTARVYAFTMICSSLNLCGFVGAYIAYCNGSLEVSAYPTIRASVTQRKIMIILILVVLFKTFEPL